MLRLTSTYLVPFALLWSVGKASINPDPEIRVNPWTIQEPAAAFFSLWAAIVHLKQYLEFRKVASKYPTYEYKNSQFWYSSMWVFTCTSSALFHAHETKWNEKMDYYGVLCAIFASLYAVSERALGIGNKKYWRAKMLLALPIVSVCAYMLWHMETVLFDYGFHNNVCAVGLVLHALVCLVLYMRLRGIATHTKYLLVGHLIVVVAGWFELYDFRPLLYRTFDGHSLWHFSAIWTAVAFHHFNMRDPEFMKSMKETKTK
jgi:post-GPI attachment to proteins factor 3